MCKSFGFLLGFDFLFGWLVLVFEFFHHLLVQTSRVENKVKIEGVKENQQEAEYSQLAIAESTSMS